METTEKYGLQNKPKETSVALNIDNEVCQDQNTIANYFKQIFHYGCGKTCGKDANAKEDFNVTPSLFVIFIGKEILTNIVLQ